MGTKAEAVGTLLTSVDDKGEAVGTLLTSVDDKDEAVSHTTTKLRRRQVTQIPVPRENSLMSDSDRCEFLLELGLWSSQDTMLESPLQPHLRLRFFLSLLRATICVPNHTQSHMATHRGAAAPSLLQRESCEVQSLARRNT